jgi:hypothetical protein
VSQSLYWRVRAAFYERVPGVVRFYDPSLLRRLVEDQGMAVVSCEGEGRHVTVLASA